MEQERQRMLLGFNDLEFTAIPTCQISPVLAVWWFYIGSERSFNRVLLVHGRSQPLGRARPLQGPCPEPRFECGDPNLLLSWDITCIHTSFRDVWQHFLLVIKVWSAYLTVGLRP